MLGGAMKVGFTGTRNGLTSAQKKALEEELVKFIKRGVLTFVHGDAIGADETAHKIALLLGYNVEVYPCNIKSQRAFTIGGMVASEPAPPLERNKMIVSVSSAMIATPGGFSEELRSGTWATIRAARRAEKHLVIVWPDGRTDEERA
jgi:predicted Rossmann fold nucleotide-binding protein DprA/Smf involved in DNA uptake